MNVNEANWILQMHFLERRLSSAMFRDVYMGLIVVSITLTVFACHEKKKTTGELRNKKVLHI